MKRICQNCLRFICKEIFLISNSVFHLVMTIGWYYFTLLTKTLSGYWPTEAVNQPTNRTQAHQLCPPVLLLRVYNTCPLRILFYLTKRKKNWQRHITPMSPIWINKVWLAMLTGLRCINTNIITMNKCIQLQQGRPIRPPVTLKVQDFVGNITSLSHCSFFTIQVTCQHFTCGEKALIISYNSNCMIPASDVLHCKDCTTYGIQI